ncbi:hypothetical protein [Streptomyces sp. NPDC001250]|uniref:hypothetical protein n=1 Tax=Streptomyces sp. NPDC001250 TaxID=3154382 RepID=UPI00332333C1
MRELSGALNIKRPLHTLGADRALLPAIAAGAVADAVTKNAPRLPEEREVLGNPHAGVLNRGATAMYWSAAFTSQEVCAKQSPFEW